MGLLEDNIIRILESPEVRRINFQCGPVRIYGQGYRRVADAIRSRRLVCVHNTLAQQAGVALYQHAVGPNRVNRLQIPDPAFPNIHHKAMLVHEATHAIEDYHRRALNELDAEAAAYLAQMMYYRVQDQLPPFSGGATWMDLAGIAYNIANRLVSTPAYEVSPQEHTQLRGAIHRLVVHRHRLYRHADQNTIDYDGL